MCQLVAGPILGRLSDRYGRRPLLVVSQAGTALSFLILGLSHDFTVMLLARMLDGASGGNILVAQAYVADVTKPENRRARHRPDRHGLRPGVRARARCWAACWSALPIAPEWRLRLPFLVAAGFSTLAWVLVVVRLPESLPAGRRGPPGGPGPELARAGRRRDRPEDRPARGRRRPGGARPSRRWRGPSASSWRSGCGWAAGQAAFGFAFLGLVSAIVQGGLIRRLVPRFGEPRLILAGIAALVVGFAGLALVAELAGPAGRDPDRGRRPGPGQPDDLRACSPASRPPASRGPSSAPWPPPRPWRG